MQEEAEGHAAGRSPALWAQRATARLRQPMVLDAVALTLLVGVLTFLWGRGAGVWFWGDEGISVGIASQPVGRILELLPQDGSPPLYYLVLHMWIALVGSSDVQTHLLSLIFALATVPAALWAGWTLFGRRTGWMFALAMALNPFLASYANETRMYTMVVLLSLLAVATFLHAFVFRRRGYLPAFAVVLALLLYTHNWGLLLAVGFAAALVPCLVLQADRRQILVDAVLAFGLAGLLYAPWVPTLLYQRSEELQPWAEAPTPSLVRTDVANMVGGTVAVMALALGAGAGLAGILQRRRSSPAIAVVALATIPLVVLLGGWISAVWANRYLAAVVAPILLLAGVGLAKAGRVGVAALGALAFLTAPIAVRLPPEQKSNARAFAEQASTWLQPGDLVVSPEPMMVPMLAHYLPPGLRYFTAEGPVPYEGIVDWRDLVERLRRSDPSAALPPVIDALPAGGHLLLTCPPASLRDELESRNNGPLRQAAAEVTGGTRGEDDRAGTGRVPSASEITARTVPGPDDGLPFYELIHLRCRETADLVLDHPLLRLEMVLQAPPSVLQAPMDSYLLTKLSGEPPAS